MKNTRVRRSLAVVALVIGSAGVLSTAPSSEVSASGGCNAPYFSGHAAYMSCSGDGLAAFTVVCSGFGFWLGGGDVAVTRTSWVSGSTTLVIDCNWNKWPKSVKGYSRWI
jgi:hypothetical protein